MINKYKEIWRGRIVRMSDQLWDEVKTQANLAGVCAAEFVRLVLAEELGKPKDNVIYDGEVIGVYRNSTKNKKTKSVYTGKYACGCKKGETKLCKTHHRA